MKIFILVLSLFIVQVFAENPTPVPVPEGPLDLQTCYELAVLRSETLGMKDEDIRIAQARYWQTVGSVLPHVHFIANENIQNSGSSNNSSTSSGGFSSGGNNNRESQYTSRLNVKQPIFSGFREFSATGARRAEIEGEKQNRRRDLQLLYLDVADVFYQIDSYQNDLSILSDIQKALQDRIEELQKRVRLGKSRSGDLISAQSELAEIRITIEQVQGLLGASRELLSFLMDIPAVKIVVRDTQSVPASVSLEAYLQKTGERPDILAGIQSEISARKQLSQAKGEHWPTISAEGNYYLQELPEGNRDWNIQLTFDMPLFEGGVIEAAIREKKSLVRSSQLNLENIRRTADKDVKTAYQNFISAAAQKARIDEALKLSEENFQVQNKDYQRGVVSNLEVIDALRHKHELRRRLSDMDSDVRLSLIRLHVASGDLHP